MSGGPARRGVRDRDVLLLMAAVVVVILAANALSDLIPGMTTLLAVAPILLLVVVGATCYVLFRTLRPRS